MIGLHLLLGLAQFQGVGEGLGHGFAFHLACEAVVGTMSGMMGLMTVATGLAAGSAKGGDGTAPKVGKVKNLLQDVISVLLQSGKGFGHWHLQILAYHYVRILKLKKEIQ